MDAVSEGRLAQVNPTLAQKIRQVADQMASSGVQLRIVQGLRTKAEQDALYAQGRTTPGKVVTNAKGGQSMHNYGLAVDMVPGIRGASPWQPNWNDKDPDYQKMIDLCEQQGLVAGARWVHIPDVDHFQLGGIPVTPTPAMLACLVAGGCTAVWQQFITQPPASDAPVTATAQTTNPADKTSSSS